MNLNRDFRSFAANFAPRELASAIGILLTVILALVGLAHGLGELGLASWGPAHQHLPAPDESEYTSE